MYRDNWLLKQIEESAKEVASWPQWKRDAIMIGKENKEDMENNQQISDMINKEQQDFDIKLKEKQAKVKEAYQDDTVDQILKDVYLILMKPKVLYCDNVTIDYATRCSILDRIKNLGKHASLDELKAYKKYLLLEDQE